MPDHVCAACAHPLPCTTCPATPESVGASDDFCDAACQRAWHATQGAVPLEPTRPDAAIVIPDRDDLDGITPQGADAVQWLMTGGMDRDVALELVARGHARGEQLTPEPDPAPGPADALLGDLGGACRDLHNAIARALPAHWRVALDVGTDGVTLRWVARCEHDGCAGGVTQVVARTTREHVRAHVAVDHDIVPLVRRAARHDHEQHPPAAGPGPVTQGPGPALASALQRY